MDYIKPPLSTQQHIIKLKQRGLVIDNDDRIANYLNTIGFYRLSAYFIPFEQPQNGSDSRNHNFKNDTEFDHILDLYIFDRKLRLIVMEAIERIEVAIRTKWANSLAESTSDAHAYMNTQNFRDPWLHQKKLAKVSYNLASSGEVFVKHYKDKYTQPYLPPIWVMVETLTFGELSKWFSNTKDNKLKKNIAKDVGLPSVEILQSVLQGISLIRNICAHHARLWNRRLVKPLPYIKKLNTIIQTEPDSHQSRKELFNYLIVICHMMKSLQPNTTWLDRLFIHIETASSNHQRAMGFPDDWQKDIFVKHISINLDLNWSLE